MSIEVIPRDFREPFDLFADVDHESVHLYAKQRLLSGGDVTKKLQHKYGSMVRRYPDFLERLIERGKYFEEVNDELEYIDQEMTNMRVFNAGVALACTALDSLAYETGIREDSWRKLWTSMPSANDFIAIEEEQDLTSEDYKKIGDRLGANGQLAYEQLEKPYKILFEEAYDTYQGATVNPGVFRSTYGYLTRFGQSVIYSLGQEQRLDNAVSQVMKEANLERESIHLVSKRERRMLRKSLKLSRGNQSSNS